MDNESRSLADFLECMLKWKPKDRASAREMLNHPWLKEADEYGVWMIKEHLKEFKEINHKKFPGFLEKLKNEQERGNEKKSSSSSYNENRDEDNNIIPEDDQDEESKDGEEEEEENEDDESSAYESGRSDEDSSSSEEEDGEAEQADEDD